MLRNRSSGSSWLKRRGSAILVIAGMHVVVVGALMHMGVIHVPDPEPVAIKVAFINDKQPEPPRPELPRIDPVPVAVVIPLVRVEIPFDVPPPPAAITVASHPPQPPAPPVAASSNDDMPVSVDALEYLTPLSPRYPPQAKMARAQGLVELRVLVDEQGMPREVQIQRSSGHEQLDRAAREALMKCRFRPYRQNGVARSVRAIVPINFSLTDRQMKARKDNRDEGRGERPFGGPDDHRGGPDDRHGGLEDQRQTRS